jgi:DNA-directed RNA polymerase specialized sigma24 family protein
MSGFNKDTIMGGERESFRTTQWTQIQNAGTSEKELQGKSIENLLRRYWKPVYCYLRYKGHDNERAKDITQGFFHEIVLGRDLFQRADSRKGKFRTFLLTALDRYVADVFRKETARKRNPESELIQLDSAELPEIPASSLKNDPNQVFNYAWATNMLDQILEQIKEYFSRTGREEFWLVFQDRILAPIMDNTKAPSLTEICEKYGIENEKKASNMIITVKRRFSTALKNHMRRYVQSDSELEEEFNELIEILSGGGAA